VELSSVRPLSICSYCTAIPPRFRNVFVQLIDILSLQASSICLISVRYRRVFPGPWFTLNSHAGDVVSSWNPGMRGGMGGGRGGFGGRGRGGGMGPSMMGYGGGGYGGQGTV